ncbi:transposase family protein [Streptomyces pseudovenezuelae]|uniref:transposase family protein n=1 Tax=Streptomyces pseudovenezuelae TaxID=67350 RepID=UPI003F6276FE
MLSVDVNIEIVRVDARCIADGAVCPVCGVWSNRVHGSYLRFPADVPSGGRSVVLQLRVRRFVCGNSSCARCTFVEQILADRTAALDPDRGRSGPRWPGRGSHRPGSRGVRQPQYGAPAGGRSSRAPDGRSTCGRRRRVRHPQGPPLRHRPGRHRNAPPH